MQTGGMPWGYDQLLFAVEMRACHVAICLFSYTSERAESENNKHHTSEPPQNGFEVKKEKFDLIIVRWQSRKRGEKFVHYLPHVIINNSWKAEATRIKLPETPPHVSLQQFGG